MAVNPPPVPAATLPPEIYATLSGQVDAAMVQKILNSGGNAVSGKVRRIHLLLHSTGGGIADGVLLYNYLRKLPLELIIYNGGTVASIAVLIYLAGKVRKVSKSATFMIHKPAPAP